jgi:hypothetical protein
MTSRTASHWFSVTNSMTVTAVMQRIYRRRRGGVGVMGNATTLDHEEIVRATVGS